MRAHLIWSVLVLLLSSSAGAQTRSTGQTSRTQVVLLGTGTPVADPERSGPSLAIVIGGNAYIVDSGPGLVRRAAAAEKNGVAALAPTNLTTLFLTHLHPDHTAGYPDLILGPWLLGRQAALEAFGPKGLQSMTDHLLAAWKPETDYFRAARWSEEGSKVHVHEIEPGIVYKDANVTVKAFQVKHGYLDQAFGYRFETPDRTIVVSGDTAPASAVVEACNGCDVLIHEVYCERGLRNLPLDKQDFHSHAHTSSAQLGDLASKARPKLLVLTHQLFFGCGETEIVTEIRKKYSGRVVLGRDLDKF